jgi:hypothetical protein
VLDIIAHGLKQLPHVTVPDPPRLIDFALWGTAIEQAFGAAGSFRRVLRRRLPAMRHIRCHRRLTRLDGLDFEAGLVWGVRRGSATFSPDHSAPGP